MKTAKVNFWVDTEEGLNIWNGKPVNLSVLGTIHWTPGRAFGRKIRN